jgi:hypothetical protein
VRGGRSLRSPRAVAQLAVLWRAARPRLDFGALDM